jgi:hypothetical protein
MRYDYNNIADESPMPTTKKAALEEVRALRNLLYKERQVLIKKIEKIELDGRANRGNQKAIKEAFLRELLELLKLRKIGLHGGTTPNLDKVSGFEQAIDELRTVKPQ